MKNFIQNDPRGEYWLYCKGDFRVNIGLGYTSGACSLRTSDIHVHSGKPPDCAKVAEILAELMTELGSEHGGYDRLLLYNDGGYELAAEHIAYIDRALSNASFTMRRNSADKEILWVNPR